MASTDHFDPAAYRPAHADDVQVFDRGPAESQDRYVLLREDCDDVVVISDLDYSIWEMFDGQRSVDDVCSQYLVQHRTLVMNRVFTLLQRLAAGGMLATDPGIARETANKGSTLARIRLNIPGSELAAAIAGSLVTGRVATISCGIIFAIIALFGIAVSATLPSELTVFPESGAIVATVLVMGALALVMGFLHEALRAGMLARFSGVPSPVQLGFYMGLPVFHHVSKWRQTLPRAQRLAVGVSGLAFETTLATVCAVALKLGAVSPLIYAFLIVLYLRIFLELLPLARNDFTEILRDWGNIVDLRKRALGFLRHNLFDAFFGDAKLSREQHIYLAFNIALLAWIVVAFRLGGAIITSNDFEQIVLTAGASGSGGARVVIWLLLLPFLLSTIAGAVWGGSALFAWMRRQAIITRSAGLAWLIPIFIFAASLNAATAGNMISARTEAAALLLAIIVVGGLGIRTALATISYTEGSVWAIRTWLLLAGTVATIAAALLCATGSGGKLLNSAYNAMAAALILALLLGLAKRQSILHFARTDFLLPELTLLIATILLGVLAYSQTQAGGLEAIRAQRGALLGIALLAIALDTSRRLLGQLRTPQQSLAIRNPNKSLVRSLSRASTFLVQQYAYIVGQRFGNSALQATAADLRRAGVQDFSFAKFAAQKGDLDAVSSECRKVLNALHSSLRAQVGGPCSAAIFSELFGEVHWQAKGALQEHVLPGTPWDNAFRDDLAIDGPRRREVVDTISIFRDFSVEEKQLLVSHLRYQRFAAGELIIEQGDQGDACYITLSGDVQVEERDIAGQDRILAFLGENGLFGESALLDGMPRKASVRAVTDTVLLSLTRADFLGLRKQHTELVEKVRTRLRNMHLLIKIPLFGDVAPNLLRLILPHVTTRIVSRGETIVRQGDIGRDFFIIRSGKVKVYAASDTGEAPICELGAQDYFGEIALLKEITRTATVRSLRETELLVLNKEIFTRLIHGSELFASNVAAIGDERFLNTAR
jgi:CRP-like cAMP-binding protein